MIKRPSKEVPKSLIWPKEIERYKRRMKFWHMQNYQKRLNELKELLSEFD